MAIAVYNSTPTGVTLSSVIKDICNRCGITDDKLDLSVLDGVNVIGLPLTTEVNARGAIEALQEIYLFDLIESEGRLVARDRRASSANPVMTIDGDPVLGARVAQPQPGQNPLPRVVDTRKQDNEIPGMVTIRYRSTKADFYVKNYSHQLATQQFRRSRSSVTANTKLTINSPCTLDDQIALSVAEYVLFQAYNNRTSVEFILPLNFIAIEPGDNIILDWTQSDGNPASFQVYVQEIDFGADNTLVFKGIVDPVVPAAAQPVVPVPIAAEGVYFDGRTWLYDLPAAIKNGFTSFTMSVWGETGDPRAWGSLEPRGSIIGGVSGNNGSPNLFLGRQEFFAAEWGQGGGIDYAQWDGSTPVIPLPDYDYGYDPFGPVTFPTPLTWVNFIISVSSSPCVFLSVSPLQEYGTFPTQGYDYQITYAIDWTIQVAINDVVRSNVIRQTYTEGWMTDNYYSPGDPCFGQPVGNMSCTPDYAAPRYSSFHFPTNPYKGSFNPYVLPVNSYVPPGLLQACNTGRTFPTTFTMGQNMIEGTGDYAKWAVGRYGTPFSPTGSGNNLSGCIAELYFAPNVALNLLDPAVLRKFHTAPDLSTPTRKCHPQNLGGTGDRPTGTPPALYLSGNYTNFHINRANNQPLSIHGALQPCVAFLTSTAL